jgi:GH18 family chitinase
MITSSLLLNNDLQATIFSTSSFWGGLSGNFAITNTSLQSKSNWSFSFLSTYSNFDFWNADESAVRNSDGTYTITVNAPAGAAPLAAGARFDLGFTVTSDNDPTVTVVEAVLGPLGTTSSGGSSTSTSTSSSSSSSTATSPSPSPSTSSPTTTSGTGSSTPTGSGSLVVEVQLGSSWSGAYEGTLTVRNSGSSAVAAGWSVSFLSDHRLGSVSDFQLQQQLQADGRTLVTLAAPSWAASQGLAVGASLSSYFQAQGDRGGQTVAELFTFAPTDSSTSTDSSITGSGSTTTGTGGSGSGGASTGSSGGTTPTPLPGPAGVNSGNSGDSRWGEAYFAPYVDMALWPVPDLSAIAASRGTSLLTLGFLQASGSGQLGWGGLDALAISGTNSNEQAQAIRASIQAFQQAGGDVMISLGGMNGSSLAQVGARNGMSASTLAARYAEVVTQFQLNRLDFDIEGAALADDPATALHSEALALLQQQNPHLEVWYTLPVLPTGLTADGLDVVRTALAAGVMLDGVNVMAMDYGESAAPTTGANAKSMGAYAIAAADATKGQLDALFAQFGQGFSWNMVGVTPMIGVNDVTSEVFTLADAQLLEDFARRKGLGMLSMWSIARDTPGTLGSASPTASGLDASAGSFSAIFHDYGSQNNLSLGGTVTTTPGGTTTTTGSTSTVPTGGDGGAPLPSAPTRLVGYFEEWGIYGRNFRVADVKADQLTHLNYSFFGITPTQGDLPSMAKELNVLPGAMVQAGYLGLNSNTPGGLGIHDTWAAYEKTFSQIDQLVSRRFDASQWQGLSDSRRQEYLNGGEFDVIAQADGSRLVRARADTWTDAQGGIQRLFNKVDWDGLSNARKAYLVTNSQQYSWTDQWQGSFNPGSGTTSERIAAVNGHFAAGAGRTLTLRADGDLVRNSAAWVGDDPANWQKLYAGNLNQLRLLKQLNPELSIGFAVGGWTLSGNFSTNLDDAAGREIFTQSIVDHLSYYDFFSTVDFDWEYPGGGGLESNASSLQDGRNFALTLQLLDQKLAAFEQRTGREIEISIATAGGAEKLAKLNLQGINPYVDFYNVMTYDFHGGWEMSTGHQAAMRGDSGGYDVVTAVDQFRQAGIAMDKVVLGAPAYTRAWGGVAPGSSYGYGMAGDAALAPGSFEKGNYDQKDLITGIENNSTQLVWDDSTKAAFAYNASNGIWSSIETAATIAGKAAYVRQAGLGGMMFWALSNDSSGPQSLVGAANDALRAGVSLDTIAGRAPVFDAVLGGDGRFSFSDFTNLA